MEWVDWRDKVVESISDLQAYRVPFPMSRERVPVKVGKVSQRDFPLIRERSLM